MKMGMGKMMTAVAVKNMLSWRRAPFLFSICKQFVLMMMVMMMIMVVVMMVEIKNMLSWRREPFLFSICLSHTLPTSKHLGLSHFVSNLYS